MTDNENKQPEELGEDPEVLADIARATKELTDYLKELDVDIDYWEADWRDTKDLIEGSFGLMQKHPGWSVTYVGGDEFGIDANYVLFSSKPLEWDAVHKIFDLIVEQGAELPEPYVPVCPKCNAKIEVLVSTFKAEVPVRACIENGILDVAWDPDLRMKDVVTDDEVDFWRCPECDAELFTGDQDAEMTKFLKGGD